MLGDDFINNIDKYRAVGLVGVHDWADRLSHVYSVAIFIICTAIVASKTYVFRPLACYVPVVPGGTKIQPYLESYCWVTGTIPLRINESLPEQDGHWSYLSDDRKITYYQWVPFVLGLQTVLFYVPYILWQNISFNRLGLDITAIIATASNALKATNPKERVKAVSQAAKKLELMLFAHRDTRTGALADMRRKLYQMCGICLVSKRLGTWIVASYLIVKLLFLTNAVGQLFLMKHFLGFNQSVMAFGIHLAQSLLLQHDWRSTLYFPRVAFCNVELRHVGERSNNYLAMCALPINMINEKIYIFLWFWTLFVALSTLCSICSWITRLITRRNRANAIRKYLKLRPQVEDLADDQKPLTPASRYEFDPDSPENVDKFVAEFLRLDGVFIISMLTVNCGDVLTGEVVCLLWQAWLDRYAGIHDFRCDGFEPIEEDSMENDYSKLDTLPLRKAE